MTERRILEPVTFNCANCGREITYMPTKGRPRRWCSERCRRIRMHSGTCVDCGARTYNGSLPAPDRCHGCKTTHMAKWNRDRVAHALSVYCARYGIPSARDWDRKGAPEGMPRPSTVQRYFGSWNEGIRSAGFEPRKPGQNKKSAGR